MRRILAAGAALAALFAANQAYAVDYCVGSTNLVPNPLSPDCAPANVGFANQAVANASTSGHFATAAFPDGTISADIGRNGIAAGGTVAVPLIDRFLFRLPADGLGTGSVTTTGILGTVIDLDFVQILFNGINIPVTGQFTSFESAGNGLGFALNATDLNVLEIRYIARGNGSYGGNLTFIPEGAIPEPSTWALMLAGFGAIGLTMRRRRKAQPQVRFAF